MFDGPIPFLPFLQAVVRVSAQEGDLFPQVPEFVVTVLHESSCSFPESVFCSCSPKIQACYFPKAHSLAVWPAVQEIYPGIPDRGPLYLFSAGGKND